MKEMRDVIVLLPGIMGSVLQKDNKDIWGLSAGAVSRAIWNLGDNIKDLAIPSEEINNFDYDDGVQATRLFSDTHLIPWFWKIDGYSLISQTLHSNFKLTEGENYFEFPYDWRRDNRIAAHRLRRQSHEWLKNWRDKSGNNDAKLILIGHSMGGLISRYFLEVLEGWKDTRKLITFGTPYQGSMNALDFIANGLKKNIGPIKLLDFSELVRSFTSGYQLLPTYKCWDSGGGNYVRINDDSVKVNNFDSERLVDAFKFHNEIKDAVENNKTIDEYQNNGYQTHPFIGLYQPTSLSALLYNEKVEILQEIGGEDLDGDGTVPSISATPYEWTSKQIDTAFYVAEQHGSIQNNNSALVQVVRLLSNQNINFERYRNLVTSRIGLDISDAFGTDEEITLQARSESFTDLKAVIQNTDTGEIVRKGVLEKTPGQWQNVTFPVLSEGTYRLTVSTLEEEKPAEAVNDVFLVLNS